MKGELDASWKTAVKLWWSLFWRAFSLSVVIVPLVLFAFMQIVGLLGIKGFFVFYITQAIQIVLGIIIFICVIKWILTKGARGYKVVLIEKERSE